MNHSHFTVPKFAAALFAAVCFTSFPPSALTQEPPASASQSALDTAALVDRYGASAVSVDIYLRRDKLGKLPEYEISYLCPNCGGTHTKNLFRCVTDNMPLRLPGYAVAADKIITGDIGLRPDIIDRINVRFGEKNADAKITSVYPDNGALELTLEKAISGLKPLSFTGKPSDTLYAFFSVAEDGMQLAGVRPIAKGDSRRSLDFGFDFIRGIPNTVLLNKDGEPVTLSFASNLRMDEAFSAPDKWKKVEASAFERSLVKMEEQIAGSFYPIEITLTTKQQKPGSSLRRSYSSSESKNEFNTIAMLLPDGNLFAFLSLPQMETARLSGAVITLPDGKKLKASFVGSLRRYGAIAFKPESPLPGKPIAFPADTAQNQLVFQPVLRVVIRDYDGRINADLTRTIVKEIKTGKNNYICVSPAGGTMGGFVFSEQLTPFVFPLVDRDTESRSSYSSRDAEPVPVKAVLDILNAQSPFDTLNVPRETEKQEKQTAYFGIEEQELTPELVKSKKITRFFAADDLESRYGDSCGILVTRVKPGSMAESAGIKADDILLYLRSSESQMPVQIEHDDGGFDGEFPWDRYDEIPEQIFDDIPVPWGTPSGINTLLSRFGIGSSVVIGMIRDGQFMEKQIQVSEPPVMFESAPRASAKSIGLTVADLTSEVREYFHMDAAAPGVVISKIRTGSAASVAGLKPFELITSVDGSPVKSAAEFMKAIEGKSELSLSVRRLVATRVVKVKVPHGPIVK